MKKIETEIRQQNADIESILIEWSSYLPEIKFKSEVLDDVIQQIRDILA